MSLVKSFKHLNREDEARLSEFFNSTALLCKGTDKGPRPAYRGGCLDWMLAAFAPVVWTVGAHLGLDPPLVRGATLALATFASLGFLRSFAAVRRSRRVTAAEEGWYGLAWSADELCHRSLHLCAIATWSEVKDLRYFPPEAGGVLDDTLWIHLEGGERLLIETRDGFFAGRSLAEWYQDLSAQWGKITQRTPSGDEASEHEI